MASWSGERRAAAWATAGLVVLLVFTLTLYLFFRPYPRSAYADMQPSFEALKTLGPVSEVRYWGTPCAWIHKAIDLPGACGFRYIDFRVELTRTVAADSTCRSLAELMQPLASEPLTVATFGERCSVYGRIGVTRIRIAIDRTECCLGFGLVS